MVNGFSSTAWVSHIEGVKDKETLIFVSNNQQPMIKINKSVTEITIEDILKGYRKMRALGNTQLIRV